MAQRCAVLREVFTAAASRRAAFWVCETRGRSGDDVHGVGWMQDTDVDHGYTQWCSPGHYYCARSTDGANAVYWWMYSGHLVKMGVDDKDEAG